MGFGVRCDTCEHYASYEHTPKAARAAAKSLGWFRKRGPDGKMLDTCPDCHYREVIERQAAAEALEGI